MPANGGADSPPPTSRRPTPTDPTARDARSNRPVVTDPAPSNPGHRQPPPTSQRPTGAPGTISHTDPARTTPDPARPVAGSATTPAPATPARVLTSAMDDDPATSADPVPVVRQPSSPGRQARTLDSTATGTASGTAAPSPRTTASETPAPSPSDSPSAPSEPQASSPVPAAPTAPGSSVVPATAPAATVAQTPGAALTAPANVLQPAVVGDRVAVTRDAAVVFWRIPETAGTAIDAAARSVEPASAPSAPSLLRVLPASPRLAARTHPTPRREVARRSSPAQDNAAGPDAPPGPPGHLTAAGNGSAPGGTSGQCCVVLAAFLALSYQRLCRHRVRPVLQGPGGVALLLQRPG
jgi:hypothetical protein